MKIRKLEMQGFKSFADRTIFHFGAGISGIVGPNGCGKSNVVDGLKWCIGEQSARSLRGDSMSDVIFAGSAARAAVNLAEVSLTLVAGDTAFPGIWERFAELEITRRLFRDGHSEYLVNQERVRLRDIQDIFLDTGVGNQMYSFIEQGRIGQIVHARPEQRRQLIEEAAGITRFKARREETQERLAATRGSLEKVAERADDLSRQVKTAERQVQRVLRWRALSARQRQLEIAVALGRFSELIGRRRELSSSTRKAQDALAEANRAVERNEQQLAERRSSLEKSEEAANQARDRLGELEAQRRVEESAWAFQSREEQGSRARLERLNLDQEELRRERDRATAELEGHTAARTEVEKLLASSRQSLDQANADAVRLMEEVRRAREQRDQANRQAQEGFEVATRAQAARSAMDSRRQDLAQRIQRAEQQQSAATQHATWIEEEVQRQAAAVKTAEAELQKARVEADQARAAIAKAEAEVQQLVKDQRTADQALTDATRERERVRTRHDTLDDLQRRNTDAPDGVRAALNVAGTMGLLAQHLDVPESLETVLARALDGMLELVLVPDAAVALKAAGSTRGSRLRMMVVPKEAGPPEGLASGIGGDRVGQTTLSALLPDARVVPTLKDALEQWAPGRTVVCQDGALLRADGVMVLGSTEGGAGAAALRRRRELAELKESLAAADALALACRTSVDRAVERVRGAEQAIVLARQSVSQATGEQRARDAALTEARHRQREQEGEKVRGQRTLEALAIELKNLRASKDALEKEEGRLDQQLVEGEQRRKDGEAKKAEAQALLERIEPEYGAVGATAQRLRAEVSHAQKELGTWQAAERSAKDRMERAAGRSTQVAQERTELEARLVELAVEAEATRVKLQELGQLQGEVREELDQRKEALKEERETVRLGEAALRAARDRRDQAKEQAVELEALLGAVKGEIERVVQELQERQGVGLAALLDRLERDGQVLLPGYEPTDIPGNLTVEPVPVLRLDRNSLGTARAAELAEVREAISRAGGVNLGAEEEYRALLEQWTEIEKQRQDLLEAMDIIEKALAKINRTCRERFQEAFEQVNTRFGQTYPRLVGGGFARLELVDDEDLLSCGIEIVVQPPGKKVQNLALLSGGEKAMAAIALIFALFQVKPSPFCVLDEVDAPLDEANGARFNDMLKEMSDFSQFIVVTHNKKTMEGASTLYGVTMPEPGTSRLVSVRLD